MPDPEQATTGAGAARALVVPVGGTPGAPLRAIQEVAPRWVAFVASRDTVTNIGEIERLLGRQLSWKRVITTPDPQDLNATYRQIAMELPRVLAEWGVSWPQVTVDLTGGTKVMTAALMLATIHRAQRYLYVGGEERDRGGTGVVVAGRERPVQAINPWEQLATDSLRQFAWAFNRLQFAGAIATARQAAERAGIERRAYLRALATLAEGFAAWDRFDYKRAQGLVGRCVAALAQEWAHAETHRPLIAQLERCKRAIDDLLATARQEAPSRLLLQDLLANAIRRGEVEQRYDDAVARLYRFVEGLAQQALWDDCHVSTGAVPMEALPEIGEFGDLRRQAAAAGRRTVAIPLQRAYELLQANGHALGAALSRVQRDGRLGKCLVARNRSLLAHGTEPVGKETFERLRDECLELGGWSRGGLITFPALPED
ncbi:MAG: TIGR02710 family CRISPR-associated protein [Candidatus Rokubacteria bacterium]|nr:TIGR02710 family CRISPR-associated protein [Candidatus Rokubacteria bacterium]